MQKFLAVLAGMFLVQAASAAEPAVGDTIDFRTWFSSVQSSMPPLSLTERGVIDSIRTASGVPVKEFSISIKATENASWWSPSMPPGGIQAKMTTSSQTPSKIRSKSSKFSNCNWLTGIYSDFEFIGNREFYFPILPAAQSYQNGDSYLVRLSDTVGVMFTFSTASGAGFKGEIYRYSGAQDDSETKVNIADALLITVSEANPFRFGGIVAASQAGPYIGMDLSCCGAGSYGLNIAGYKPAVPLSVHQSYAITGNKANQGIAGSAKDLLGRSYSTKQKKMLSRLELQ